MKFYSTLLLAEDKMLKKKRDTCPESLSCYFTHDIHAKPEQYPIFPPRGWITQYFIRFTYVIGAHPISPPYRFYFITAITFLILSTLEPYMHN